MPALEVASVGARRAAAAAGRRPAGGPAGAGDHGAAVDAAGRPPPHRCASARPCCMCGRWRRTVARRRRWRPRRRSDAGWSTRPGSTRRPRWPSSSSRSPPGRVVAPAVRAGRQAGRPDGRSPARPRGGAAAARRARRRHADRPRRRRQDPARARHRGRLGRARDAVVVPLAVVDRAERVCQAVASHWACGTSGEVRPDRRRGCARRPRAAAGAGQLRARGRRLPRARGRGPAQRARASACSPRRGSRCRCRGSTSCGCSRCPCRATSRTSTRCGGSPACARSSSTRAGGGRLRAEPRRRRRPGRGAAPTGRAAARDRAGRAPGRGDAAARGPRAARPRARPRHRAAGPEDARQRTLRATIDSSYRLLDEDEQRLLRAIAPFPGGVDLATVEALRGVGDGDPLDLLHRPGRRVAAGGGRRERAVPAALHRARLPPRRDRCARRARTPRAAVRRALPGRRRGDPRRACYGRRRGGHRPAAAGRAGQPPGRARPRARHGDARDAGSRSPSRLTRSHLARPARDLGLGMELADDPCWRTSPQRVLILAPPPRRPGWSATSRRSRGSPTRRSRWPSDDRPAPLAGLERPRAVAHFRGDFARPSSPGCARQKAPAGERGRVRRLRSARRGVRRRPRDGSPAAGPGHEASATCASLITRSWRTSRASCARRRSPGLDPVLPRGHRAGRAGGPTSSRAWRGCPSRDPRRTGDVAGAAEGFAT